MRWSVRNVVLVFIPLQDMEGPDGCVGHTFLVAGELDRASVNVSDPEHREKPEPLPKEETVKTLAISKGVRRRGWYAMDVSQWHKAGPNQTEKQRWNIVLTYLKPDRSKKKGDDPRLADLTSLVFHNDHWKALMGRRNKKYQGPKTFFRALRWQLLAEKEQEEQVGKKGKKRKRE